MNGEIRLPIGWQLTRLGHLGRFTSSGIDKLIRDDEPLVRMVNYTNVYGNPRATIDSSQELMSVSCSPRKAISCSLRQGDILFTPSSETTDDIGVSAVVLEDMPGTVFSYHLVRFRPSEQQLDVAYSKFLCNNTEVLQQFSAAAVGTTRQLLSRGDLRSAFVLLPPLDQQRAIADFLDRKTAAIDALIAKKERLVELLQEKRQALITQGVTKGLDPNAPMEDSGLPWLGSLPSHWKLRRLKHLSHRISGRLVYQPAQYFTDDGVPFIMGNNVTERGLVLNETKFIPPEVNARFAHHALREGDVVMVRVGAPGVTAVVGRDADGLNCGSLMIVRRNPAFDSRWLAAVMNSPLIRAQIDLVQYGAAQEQINITDAVNFWFPTPPLEEQRRIAEFLSAATNLLDATLDKVRAQLERVREYRQALITAAVTGKIGASKEAA